MQNSRQQLYLYLPILLAIYLLSGCQHPETSALWQPRGPLPPRKIVLSFVGDIMAHRPNFEMDAYARIYQGVADILHSDSITFANLESPVDARRAYHSWPRFNVQPPYVQAAIEGGMDFFSLANNHTNDWGIGGVQYTRQILEALRQQELYRGRWIYYGGIRTNNQNADQYIIEEIWRDGWHLGILTLTHFLNDPSNGAHYVQVVDYHNSEQVERILQLIRREDAKYDLLIVSYHGGEEYQLQPHPAKRRLFREMVAAGADIVWGHHPHVLQPWEVMQEDRQSALLIYSLGNFVSGQTWFVGADQFSRARAFTGDSLILQAEYLMQNNSSYLQRVEAIPISHWKDPDGGVEVRSYHDLLNADDIGEQWQRYYAARAAILQQTFGIQSSIVFPPVYLSF